MMRSSKACTKQFSFIAARMLVDVDNESSPSFLDKDSMIRLERLAASDSNYRVSPISCS